MPRPDLLARLAVPLFFAALAFTLFMALDPLPPAFVLDRYGDKSEHMAAFFTLAALAGIGFPRVGAWRILEHLSFIGALIEVFQASPHINRDCDWTDWAADTSAVAVALLLVRWLAPRLTARRAVAA